MIHSDIFAVESLTELPLLAEKDSALVLFMVCTQGRMRTRVGGNEYEVYANDVLICDTRHIADNYMTTPDFQSINICVTPKAMDEAFLYAFRQERQSMDRALYIRSHPLLHMNERQKQVTSAYITLLQTYRQDENDPLNRRQLWLLMQMTVNELLSWGDENKENTTGQQDDKNTPRSLQLFRQFLLLLQQADGRQREVSWYAEQLAITPKYLSVITHQNCGQSAAVLIHKSTKTTIRYYLLNTDLSIKEIANRMNFSSATFFCKFVRQHFGQSPVTIRQQH